MVKLSIWLGASLALILACGCSRTEPSGAAAKAGPTEIRFAHAHAPDLNGELHFSAVAFAEAVTSLSDRLSVKIFPQGSLGSEREVYEGMQLGSGAAVTVSGSAILNNFDQRIGVLDLPYLWEDYEHVHRVLDGEAGKNLAAGLERQGLVVLAWLDGWGYRNLITTSKPVRRPEDMRGLKIRTIPTPVYLAALRMMGTNPTPMAYGEVYTALQMGVIDGFEQAPAIVVAEKFYEVAKHMTQTRHLFPALVICYSKAQWDRLSPDDQATLRQAGKIAQDRERALAPVREAEALKSLQQRGMTLHAFDPSVFAEAAVTLQDQLAAERGATDLLQQIRAAKMKK